MSNGMFANLEAALADVATKADAKNVAEAQFKAASREHDAALAAAQKLYRDLQNALSPIVQTGTNYHP